MPFLDRTTTANGDSHQDDGTTYRSPLAADGEMNYPTTMPIAIIGMSCRFPGDATSPEKLWGLLSQARSAWSEVPKIRFNNVSFYHPEASRLGTVGSTPSN